LQKCRHFLNCTTLVRNHWTCIRKLWLNILRVII
jgi:hypothetical protein